MAPSFGFAQKKNSYQKSSSFKKVSRTYKTVPEKFCKNAENLIMRKIPFEAPEFFPQSFGLNFLGENPETQLSHH